MGFTIKSLGHSCLFIESINGIKILCDPWLSGNKNAVIKPEEITELDAILISHGAFDHLGDAIEIAKNTGASLYCGPDVYDHALNSGINKNQLNMLVWGTELNCQGVKIRSIEAKHLSYFKDGDNKITGMPMSFIIRMEDDTGIYFSGDTSIFSDMKFFGELYPVKYGFYCVSGIPGLPYEMDYREAALAANMWGAKYAIPVHYPPETDHPYLFEAELKRINPKIEVIILNVGEVITT